MNLKPQARNPGSENRMAGLERPLDSFRRYLTASLASTLLLCGAACHAQQPITQAPAPTAGINEALMPKLGWKVAVQCWVSNKLTLFEAIENIQAIGVHRMELLARQRIARDIPAKNDPDMDASSLHPCNLLPIKELGSPG